VSNSLDLYDELQDKLRDNSRREEELTKFRDTIRDNFATVSLHEPTEVYTPPASPNKPSFLVGPNQDFDGPKDFASASPATGHLSEQGFKDVVQDFRESGSARDAATRHAAADRAATTIKNELASPGKEEVLGEVRNQVAFAARELGEAAGLNKVESALAAEALDHALMKQGIRTLVDKGFDLGSRYSPSSSAVSKSMSDQFNISKTLENAGDYLASKGVTTDKLRDFLGKHAGKLAVVASLDSQDIKTAAAIVLKAPDAYAALNDEKFRKSLGNALVSAGEAASFVSKAGGSAAVVAGAALRGESAEDMGRHAFRFGMAVAGGVVGGVAGGAVSMGAGTALGAIGGQAAGSALADKILDYFDKEFGGGRGADQDKSKDLAEVAKSSSLSSRSGEDLGKSMEMSRGAASDRAMG